MPTHDSKCAFASEYFMIHKEYSDEILQEWVSFIKAYAAVFIEILDSLDDKKVFAEYKGTVGDVAVYTKYLHTKTNAVIMGSITDHSAGNKFNDGTFLAGHFTYVGSGAFKTHSKLFLDLLEAHDVFIEKLRCMFPLFRSEINNIVPALVMTNLKIVFVVQNKDNDHCIMHRIIDIMKHIAKPVRIKMSENLYAYGIIVSI